MNKFQTYISVALFSLTLFSCTKENKWTPETEAAFKENAKKEMVSGEDAMPEDEANVMVDCMTEKLKKQNILPNDVEKSENEALLVKIATECAQGNFKDE